MYFSNVTEFKYKNGKKPDVTILTMKVFHFFGNLSYVFISDV